MKYKLILIIILLIPINTYSVYYEKLNNYNIYIVDTNYNTSKYDNNIYIIDDRNNSQDIQIVNSYKINNKQLQRKIIDIILNYNEKYPTNNWIRSKESMYIEWNIHNMLYKLNIYKSHTISVDFEDKEEKLFYILYKYLQNIKNVL